MGEGRSHEVSDGPSAFRAVRKLESLTAADPFACTGDSERGLCVLGETDLSLRCAML